MLCHAKQQEFRRLGRDDRHTPSALYQHSKGKNIYVIHRSSVARWSVAGVRKIIQAMAFDLQKEDEMQPEAFIQTSGSSGSTSPSLLLLALSLWVRLWSVREEPS